MAMRGRPIEFDRKSQGTIRFYIEDDKKKKLQIYAIKNGTSLQSLFGEAADVILKNIEEEK